MNYALDAGPMIAFMDDEPGAEVVEDLLTEPGSACHAHIFNLTEVYYLYFRRGGASMAEDAVQTLTEAGIGIRSDNDTAFWKAAATCKGRHRIALPDAFCLALARRLGGTLVTTDHAEFDPLVPLGYCPILFIRSPRRMNSRLQTARSRPAPTPQPAGPVARVPTQWVTTSGLPQP